jgi:hypothetical protein
MHPAGRIGFEVSQNIGDGSVRTKLYEKMHVVSDAVYAQ